MTQASIQTPALTHREEGFSLPEVLIAMGIMLVVLAGTFAAMTQAMEAHHAAKQLTGMNNNLRTAMDLIVRDMLQVGQGLPVGRRIGVPTGPGAMPINRPGVRAGRATLGGCAGVTTFPNQPSLAAVTVGPDLGPRVNGQCTDVITTLQADGSAEGFNVTSIAANGQSLTIHPDWLIADNPDEDGDNLRPGDLLMIAKGSTSVLVQITNIVDQTVTFAPDAARDPMGLNQFNTALTMQGTTNQLKAQAPVDPDAPAVVGGVTQQGPSTATRIRMITYFVGFHPNDPVTPRLMRVINSGLVYNGAAPVTGTPHADVPGNAVGFDMQTLRLTYDLVYDLDDLLENPTGVRMDAADFTTAGSCDPDPCSVNQIRKVNVVLAGRSNSRAKQTGDFFRNTLFTQVSLRSLAFVDEYQ